MHVPPFPVQRLLRNPLADVIVAMIAFGTTVSLTLWARQSGHPERRAFVTTIISVGGFAIVVNVVAPTQGWWGGQCRQRPAPGHSGARHGLEAPVSRRRPATSL